ncbi:MAG: hypothetical protein RL519_1174, partial [Pseudomonadota bacterium]
MVARLPFGWRLGAAGKIAWKGSQLSCA